MFIQSCVFILGDSTNVAFTALAAYNLHNYYQNQIIVFSRVVTNIGNDYDATVGVFRCRISGTYIFFVSLLTERGVAMSAKFSRNNVEVEPIYSPVVPNTYGPGSNMVALQLQTGDTVTLRSRHDVSGPTYDEDSSFSGFLLYPTY